MILDFSGVICSRWWCEEEHVEAGTGFARLLSPFDRLVLDVNSVCCLFSKPCQNAATF